jgi:hypothetical protein
LLLLLVACSSSSSSSPTTPSPTPAPTADPPADCPAAPARDAAAYAERQKVLYGAIAVGRGFSWEPDPTVANVETARSTCASTSEDVRYLCIEGLAQTYGAAVGKQHLAGGPAAAKSLREFAAVFARVDTRWTPIHCRGLGAGLNAGGVLTADLATVLSVLDPRCRNIAHEGFSGRVVMRYMKLSPGSVPDGAALDALELDTGCAGLDASWCGFGGGRILGNLFPGDPTTAIRGCRGASRGACLSGISYVNAYLFDPDDLARVVLPLDTLQGADRAAYMVGIASALQWKLRTDPEATERRIACLPARDRELVLRIRATAENCKLFDFRDGTDCRWSEVTR